MPPLTSCPSHRLAFVESSPECGGHFTRVSCTQGVRLFALVGGIFVVVASVAPARLIEIFLCSLINMNIDNDMMIHQLMEEDPFDTDVHENLLIFLSSTNANRQSLEG
jgi:hypothetical protein